MSLLPSLRSNNSNKDDKSSGNKKKQSTSSKASTLPQSNSASAFSRSAVKTSVEPMASLSCFQIKIDSFNVDEVVGILSPYSLAIQAIYIVSRDIDKFQAMNLRHWAVKINAYPLLLSIDFTATPNGAQFNLDTVMASQCEMNDFFHYLKYDPKLNKYHRLEWDILSFVEPSHDIKTNELISINCNDLKVCDIASFIYQFANNTKDYNPVRNNCQRFAYELYDFVIGENYPNKVKEIEKLLQSQFDKNREKVKQKQIKKQEKKEKEEKDEKEKDDDKDKDKDKNKGKKDKKKKKNKKHKSKDKDKHKNKHENTDDDHHKHKNKSGKSKHKSKSKKKLKKKQKECDNIENGVTNGNGGNGNGDVNDDWANRGLLPQNMSNDNLGDEDEKDKLNDENVNE